MKAIVNPSVMHKELKYLSTIVRKNNIIPITGGILMSFDKDKLTITGTNLETFAMIETHCECRTPFKIVVDYADMLGICSKISEPMQIELKINVVIVSTPSDSLEYGTVGEPKHFPAMSDEEKWRKIDIENDFFSSLSKSDACKSENELMTKINKVCVDIKKDKLITVGCDGFIMYKKEFTHASTIERSVMLSSHFVSLTQTFKDAEFYLGERHSKAICGNITVISLLGEEKYANYEVIVPKNPKFNLTLSKIVLQRKLNMIKVVADSTTNEVSIFFTDQGITLKSSDSLLNKKGETKIECKHTVEVPQINFNSAFLYHLIDLIDFDEIDFAIGTSNKNVIIKPSNDDSIVCGAMPFVLNN